jgi:hypothetical protein
MKLVLQIAGGILLAVLILGVAYRLYTTPSKDEQDAEWQRAHIELCEEVGNAARREAIAVGDAERASGDREEALKTYANADHTYQMAVKDCLAPHPVERTEHRCAAGTVQDDKGDCWAAERQ